MIIMKFGGSSVAGAERIRRVAEIVRGRLEQRPVVVCSAFRGVTDQLLASARASLEGDRSLLQSLREAHYRAAEELGLSRDLVKPCLDELSDILKGISLLKELTPRTLDMVASFGERLSARVLAAHLSASGLPARPLDASAIGLLTDGRFGAANPLPEAEEELRRGLSGVEEIPVVTGFIGRTRAGELTTLGRNGSDYSATIIGAALGAREVEIWSDTDGIMTADPRVVPEAKPLESLSFAEACELAYYGGKVLHPHTLVPAVKKGIPIRVLNTFRPEHPGTLIVAELARGAESGVKSIAFRRHQWVVSVSSPRMLAGPGFLARIFESFARHEIDVDMVSTSEVTVSATTSSERNLESAVEELSREFSVEVEKGRALLCVVGDGVRSCPGVAGEVFWAMKQAGVNVLMISQGASKNNIAFVVAEADVERAVRALHRRFFPSDPR